MRGGIRTEVTNEYKSLETCALACTSLLLHGLNFHHLVLDLATARRPKEVVDNLVLLSRLN